MILTVQYPAGESSPSWFELANFPGAHSCPRNQLGERNLQQRTAGHPKAARPRPLSVQSFKCLLRFSLRPRKHTLHCGSPKEAFRYGGPARSLETSQSPRKETIHSLLETSRNVLDSAGKELRKRVRVGVCQSCCGGTPSIFRSVSQCAAFLRVLFFFRPAIESVRHNKVAALRGRTRVFTLSVDGREETRHPPIAPAAGRKQRRLDGVSSQRCPHLLYVPSERMPDVDSLRDSRKE